MRQIEKAVFFFNAVEQGNWQEVNGWLHDDFLFHGPLPDPIDKEAWLSFQMALKNAFPDWSFHMSKAEVEEEVVRCTVHITGTHTKELVLPIPGINPVPPSGKVMALPVEHARLTFRDGKIADILIEEDSHAGVLHVLEELGLE